VILKLIYLLQKVIRMTEQALSFTHNGRTKQFFFSTTTKPEYLELMLRKAFRIQDRLQGVIGKRGIYIC
jgi:hypothetical protein